MRSRFGRSPVLRYATAARRSANAVPSREAPLVYDDLALPMHVEGWADVALQRDGSWHVPSSDGWDLSSRAELTRHDRARLERAQDERDIGAAGATTSRGGLYQKVGLVL